MTPARRRWRANGPRTHDFDLHGIVGIRLRDATEDDIRTVRRQLGPLDSTLEREPDITVRFADSLGTPPVTFVGVGDTGFSDEGFFVLRGRGGVAARALLPLADIGHHPELVCERALPAVPHLLPIVNLTALAKGVLPLHASAFLDGPTGVLVTGWAKGGKTESLLAGMAAGACYVGDEWVYVTSDRRMHGLPEPIRLWAWQLDQLPALARSRPRVDRARLATWKATAAVAAAVATTQLPTSGLARRALPILARQAFLQIPPADLFGAARLALRGHVDSLVLVASHDAPDITVELTRPTEVSGRMRASLAEERAAFMAAYRQFRYAFPERSSTVVDGAAAIEARLLADLFDGLPAVRVTHPYPCDIRALGAAVRSGAVLTR